MMFVPPINQLARAPQKFPGTPSQPIGPSAFYSPAEATRVFKSFAREKSQEIGRNCAAFYLLFCFTPTQVVRVVWRGKVEKTLVNKQLFVGPQLICLILAAQFFLLFFNFPGIDF